VQVFSGIRILYGEILFWRKKMSYSIYYGHINFGITYNYANIYYRVFGKKGIRIIYGLSGRESIPILQRAISKLIGDIDKDSWKPTEGNARRALKELLVIALTSPDDVWSGD
jgi:hypothetical protein